MSGQAKGLRVGLVGSCQVIGLGASLRRMWPDADVKAWSLNAHCPETPEAIAAQLAGCDLVISQVRNAAEPLAFARLCETAARAVFLPVFVFNGYHPDIIYIRAGDVPVVGPFQCLHSAIIAGCYVLGVPAARTARLFNALTYACLGYFDAFDHACDLLIESYASAGYDLVPLVDEWTARGDAFMYTLNHPRIYVLARLAQMVAVRAGLTDEGSSVPEGVDDFLAHNFLWPVYPELARRLGLPKGDMVVATSSRTLERRPAQLRRITDVIGEFYAVYAGQDAAAFRAAIPERILQGLREVLAS